MFRLTIVDFAVDRKGTLTMSHEFAIPEEESAVGIPCWPEILT